MSKQADEPIATDNLLDDLETRLGDVADGVGAIAGVSREPFNNPAQAAAALLGIAYVSRKLVDDLRQILELIAAAGRV